MSESTAAGVETPVIIGTAGHVDHGKSALVLRLTGTDPDRLPQEKARGITIDLGFAELRLPSQRIVGLVDVPGHGHYVRAMVAGATGVDVALLVVAADDGVMPQTREHLRILELVGVRRMVVALTKCDLVDDDDWLELVRSDVEEYLGTTAFAGAPVIAVSSRTGRGIDELAAALDAAVDAVLASGEVERRLALPARLPIDRSFNVAGVGAVVTGTLRSGSFAPGDAVEIYPQGVKARVRGVQVHGHDIERAVAGQRTALNLSGVSVDEATRGSTVAAPGSLRGTDRFDARLRWLGRDGRPAPLVSGERVHVCSGTTEALGRILLMDGAGQLACGDEALVQIRLEEPLALRSRDRFVVMAYSPVELVGGGEVLWARPARRTTLADEERTLLAALGSGDDRAAVASFVRLAPVPLPAADVAASLDLPEGEASDLLGALAGDGELRALPCGQGPAVYVAPATLEALCARMGEALREAGPSGMPLLGLRDAACPRASDATFAALADEAVARGVAGRFEANLIAAELLGQAQRESDELLANVGGKLRELGLGAPFDEELAPLVGLDVATTRRALRLLADRGLAEAIDRSFYLSSEAAAEARERVRAAIEAAGGSASASELREALGLSRKYALPVLEHFDQVGFTKRDRDNQSARQLAKP